MEWEELSPEKKERVIRAWVSGGWGGVVWVGLRHWGRGDR